MLLSSTGFTVVLTERWLSGENDAEEFAISPLDVSDDEILFWLDVSPSPNRDKPVTGVPNSPKGLYDWLAANPDLTVSTAQPVTIGDGKPAVNSGQLTAFAPRVSGILASVRLPADLRP